MIAIKVTNKSPNPLPEYKTNGAAGMDLMAWLPQSIVLQPMERILVPTGLYIALPSGYEAQIRPRSGLSINKGITIINTPGTIDSDYRGEIKIPIINLSTEPQLIANGERIAQMVIAPVAQGIWQETDKLDDTDRGAGGFGHTGL